MTIQQQDFRLSANKFEIPESIQHSPGMVFGEHRIKSVLLSTDLSYIQNLQADAVMIINPFEKSTHLDQVIIDFSNKPVFCDAGGGFLREEATIKSAQAAVDIGAAGIVISKPTSPEMISRIRKEVTGKLIYTVMFDGEPVRELASAGIDVFNIATGEYTAESVSQVRQQLPDIPVMASGGPYDSTILETIEMGADAIVFNPPTATEILRSVFDEYRSINK